MRLFVVILVLVLVSCVPSPSPSAPPATISPPALGEGPVPPAPEVWMTPVDSTTGTGAAVVPRVAVMNSGMPLGEGALALLRSKISLRAWPSMALVDSTFQTVDAKGDNPGQSSTIDVVPNQPLTDAWYVLALSDLPDSFRWPRYQPLVTDPRIGYGVRFRTSSSPFVASVRMCSKGDGSTEVILDYSELIIPALNDLPAVAQAGPCPADAITTPQQTLVGALSSKCPPGLDRQRPVNVHHGAGHVSASGVHVLPFTAAIVPSMMDPAGPGCSIARLPLPE